MEGGCASKFNCHRIPPEERECLCMTQPAKHAGVTSCPRAAAPAHLTQEDSFMGRNTTQVKIKARSAKQKEINLFERRCEADTALLAGQGWRLDLLGRLQEASGRGM